MESDVDHRMGNPLSKAFRWTDNRIVEKYLASDDDARRLMESMYGEKVLKKLIEFWERERENEIASQKFIQENTVPSKP